MTLINPTTGEAIAKYQGMKQWREALQQDEQLWSTIYHMVYSTMKGVEIDLTPADEPSEVEENANTEETELS